MLCPNNFTRFDDLKDYIDIINEMKRNPERFNKDFYDFTIWFCEDKNLCDLFCDCKLNPIAFYAFAKYKVENKSLKWLKNVITTIVNKEDT